MEYSERTSLNRELVLDFFLVLSRMEFALKLEGYSTGDDKTVKPDWDSFAKDISKSFSCENNEALSTAIDYYLAYPPQKQILDKGQLSWVSSLPNNTTEIEKVIILVRRVRNNLFHGGKYNGQVHEETERNELLLQMGITIIKEAIHCSQKVEKAYNGSAI